MFLSENDFTFGVSILPLVSIDLCIISPAYKILLVKRNSRPARNFYFTPGGRIRKNESIPEALNRIAKEEIGLERLIELNPLLMGAWDHFYADSAFAVDVSTHYVNLPHFVILSDQQIQELNIKYGSNCQHDSYIWMDLLDTTKNIDVHHYSKLYAEYILKHF